jgi:hypothetical protein
LENPSELTYAVELLLARLFDEEIVVKGLARQRDASASITGWLAGSGFIVKIRTQLMPRLIGYLMRTSARKRVDIPRLEKASLRISL